MEGSIESLSENTFKIKLAKPKDISRLLDQTTIALEGKNKQKLNKNWIKLNFLVHLFRFTRNIRQSGKITSRDTWLEGQPLIGEQRTN